MPDSVTLGITAAVLGQIGLCASLLVARSRARPVYLPLAAFFLSIGVVCAGPVVSAYWPAFEALPVIASIPAYFLLGPLLWLYVNGLTSETKWLVRPSHSWHFLPSGLGVVAVGMVAALSGETRHAFFIDGEYVDGVFPLFVALYLFVLVVGWIVQTGYYAVRILHRLASYRIRLKALFASTDRSELGWLSGLLIVIGLVWSLSFAGVVSDNFFGVAVIGRGMAAGMCLILVWSLALWGLRQKPGFEGRYLDAEDDRSMARDRQAKYARSALDADQAQRIAGKIDAAMERDRLYLNPSISLHKLARHVGAPANHISQTLNETVGISFFDYVNGWRIRAAKPALAAGDGTILEVAMAVGFNARSSFYKAFKRETGQTPSEYRTNARLTATEPK